MPAKRDKTEAQLKIRLDRELHRSLQKVADERGASITKEIADRLWRSFVEEKDAGLFVSPLLRGMMELVAQAMHRAGIGSAQHVALAPEDSWIDNAYTFGQAIKAALVVLEALRPAGNPDLTELPGKAVGHGWDEVLVGQENKFGISVADLLIQEVADGKPRGMIQSERHKKQLLEDIGRLIDRLVQSRANVRRLGMSKQSEESKAGDSEK